MKSLVRDVPDTTQNPLLSAKDFFKLCRQRFRSLQFESDFIKWLIRCQKAGLLLPTFSSRTTRYYSTFQIWQVNYLLKRNIDEVNPEHYHLKDFDSLLRLFLEIQDFYLPETRGNGRVGEERDYGGDVAIDGTYFVSRSTLVLSGIRRWREKKIAEGRFRPKELLEKAKIDLGFVRSWVEKMESRAEDLDPLEDWRTFTRHISYSKRQKLKYEALLAQDLYEMSEVLKMFLRDIGGSCGEPTLLDWSDLSLEDPCMQQHWLVRRYGRDSLARPYQMLEFLVNEFDLNPRPRAIIFTEGEEWRGVKRLCEFSGYSPDLLGIEFRSIGGEGEFTLANWQCFIEYMHEKQVLLYFLVDREGSAIKTAGRLAGAARKFKAAGLEKVIPGDRIVTWPSCFEASNFTDAEISRALLRQGFAVSRQEIGQFRVAVGRTTGLIKAIARAQAVKVDKKKLAEDLVDVLIERRKKRGEVRRKRPIEAFVESSGRKIMLNHQPVGADSIRRNRQTGELG